MVLELINQSPFCAIYYGFFAQVKCCAVENHLKSVENHVELFSLYRLQVLTNLVLGNDEVYNCKIHMIKSYM